MACITEHEGFDPVCLNIWVYKQFKEGNNNPYISQVLFRLGNTYLWHTDSWLALGMADDG